MIVAIHQPQYLPWLGYFDKIDKADVFVFLDTVQFKKNEYQNRNRIKTANGWQWLTVPVIHRFQQKIKDVEINNTVRWRHKHKQSLLTNYRKSRYFEFLMPYMEKIYQKEWSNLSQLNIKIIKDIAEILGINTKLYISSQLGEFPEDPDERLISITKHLGGNTYLAGSGGKNYMDLTKYEKNGIRVMFQDFTHPVYTQLFGRFEPYMSIIDLIFNHGPDSLSIIRGQK